MSRIDKLIERLCPDGVEYRSLGEVCELARGVRVIKKTLPKKATFPYSKTPLSPWVSMLRVTAEARWPL